MVGELQVLELGMVSQDGESNFVIMVNTIAYLPIFFFSSVLVLNHLPLLGRIQDASVICLALIVKTL